MKVRRNRIHQQGASNKDYRSEGQNRPEEITRIEFLATAKPQKFSELVHKKLHRTLPMPQEETQAIYIANDKQEKPLLQIGQPRFGHLEEPQLRKRVFTGDSNTIFDERVYTSYKFKRQETLQPPENLQTRLARDKHNKNSRATQETQLVGISTKDTLKGKVDLEKVREIRRTIRRRYGNRSNVRKIFNQWDYDNSGFISAKNVIFMAKKLGLLINHNEARVLVASADHNADGLLSLDEFMDLVFSADDKFEVDLDSMKDIPEDEFLVHIGEKHSEQLNEKLTSSSKEAREDRHKNQLKTILKNKLTQIANDVRLADELKQGFITQERLQYILKKINIPESIMSEQDLKRIFDQYKKDEHKFDYKHFLNDLDEYRLVTEEIYEDPKEVEKKQTDLQRLVTRFNEREDSKFHVFDASKVNACHLEKMRKNYRKVQRIISRYIATQSEFEKMLIETHKLRDCEELAQKQFSKEELTKSIQNLFFSVGENDVTKLQVQDFLSVFQFNKQNHTRGSDIAKAIYSEEDFTWFNKVQWDVNRPPPPDGDKFHPDFVPEKISQKLQLPNQQNYLEADNSLQADLSQQGIQNRPLDNRRTKTAQGSMRRASSQPNKDQSLVRLLRKFEDRVFVGSNRAYDVYKAFDVDYDGFVSNKDLVNKLHEMAVFENDHEIAQFLNYVDPERRGYLNFREFSDKLHAGYIENSVTGQQSVLPYTQPSKDVVDHQKHLLPLVKQKVDELKNAFEPDGALRPKTRFGLTPQSQNTFTNFRPSSSSPLYQNDENEDKRKKQACDEARVNKIKNYNQDYSVKVQNIEDNKVQSYENKCRTKGLLQWNYEHRAHLQNNWK